MENKDTNADYQQVARVSDLSPFYINLLNNGSVPPSPAVKGANYECCFSKMKTVVKEKILNKFNFHGVLFQRFFSR